MLGRVVALRGMWWRWRLGRRVVRRWRRLRGFRGGGNVGWRGSGRLDTNCAHHAVVFVLQQVAVIWVRADCAWIAKIHPQSYGRVVEIAFVIVGDVDRVAEVRLVPGDAVPFDHQEMNLVNVESVKLGGA